MRQADRNVAGVLHLPADHPTAAAPAVRLDMSEVWTRERTIYGILWMYGNHDLRRRRTRPTHGRRGMRHRRKEDCDLCHGRVPGICDQHAARLEAIAAAAGIIWPGLGLSVETIPTRT